jgi:outer membrane protein assembly factor BamA
VAPEAICPTGEQPLPVLDAAPRAEFNCKPDPVKGRYCEPNVVLSIPVKLGPRTVLWDLEFAGNTHMTEQALAEAAALKLGDPVSQAELQKARRRILDLYADEGYAFANVDVDLLLSQDQTRGSARFVVSEREQVEISQIVVRGAALTENSVILSRLDIVRGGIYKRPLVRRSEEQLATLGVFSTVDIALQDPDVPAKRKVVQITVVERLPQYVDVKPGFSTGEGPRAAFEYGHRNLGGRAIQLRFRVQVGYLPDFLLFEKEVRDNFNKLSTADRIERRDTVALEFPIAKRYRLVLEGVDVRDNSRDFGLTKRAIIPTINFRPSRSVSVVGGTSFELNDARVFGDKQNLQQYLEAHPEQARLLNVPEGRSFAVALRVGGAWDRTDVPLAPTRGTLVTLEVEPVFAFLDKDSAAVQLMACQGAGNDPSTCEYRSRFIRVTNRLGAYIPFNDSGLSLALNLRVGANFQLVDHSSTYPDRLFFLGGADSLRGFLQASVIPQDIADQLQREDPNAPNQNDVLTARKVVIRGGDFLINPRAELRIPITKLVHTALFLDTGNLWRNIDNVEPFRLRYTAGTGLRFVTPIGPLAFDYGFILDRRFYETSIGAFHFSIGLY